MANSSEGKRLTEAYRQSQAQLQAQIVGRARLFQPLLGMNDVDVAAQIYVPGMVEVIRDGVRQQEAITGAYIEAHSKAETGRALTPVVPAFDETAAILDMQIRGPIAAKSTMGRGFDEQAAQAKANRLGAVGAARDVLQYGRAMIIRSAATTESDLGRGRGGRWRRVTDGKPCAFCAMLAGRGPVYTSHTVEFHTHDLCGCVGEIVYGEWEPTEAERRWRQAYVDAGNEATVVDGRRVAPKRGNGEDTILWRMRRDNPDLFHDGWSPSRTGSNASGEVLPLSTVALRDAKTLLVQAKAHEPAITSRLTALAGQRGGTMIGLDYRFKAEESLARKIASDAAAKGVTTELASKGISDALRYTMVFDEDDYAVAAKKTLDDLRAAGWQARVKNYWTAPGNPYQGVNVPMVSPTGQRVELQFHTRTSFDVKDGPMHKLYEQQRIIPEGSPDWHRLNDEMKAISESIPVPPRVELIE